MRPTPHSNGDEWFRIVQRPRWRRAAEVAALCALALLALLPAAWMLWSLAEEPTSPVPTNYRHEAPPTVTLTERGAR